MSSRLAAGAPACRGIDHPAAVPHPRRGLLGNHRRLYYALSAYWQMLSALDGLRAVLGGNRVVVIAEPGSGRGDRATLLAAVEQGVAARVLGHSSNCC